LEVIESLKLDKPVLAGHSIAGEELSSIGSRHPDKVAGLIYLDAGYSYAYYDPDLGQNDIGGPPNLNGLSPIERAIIAGEQKYTKIQGPVLAMYAFGDAKDPAPAEAQARAFEKGVPSARVIRFPRAPHYLFLTMQAIVQRQIETFIAALP
jgi:pimeloyl-ACP methyl ester carboxylesterase